LVVVFGFKHTRSTFSPSTTDWAGASKEMYDTFEELARVLHEEGKITVGTLDIHKNHVSKNRFKVRDAPMLRFFDKGQYYTFPSSGQDLKRDINVYLKFIRGGHMAGSVSSGPIPKKPWLPQWFETKDYHNPVDGKTYMGAVL